MSEQRYNGWTNKPTWLIGLWVGEGAEPMVREFVEGLEGHTQQRADILKNYVLEIFDIQEQLSTAGLDSDLMGWAVAHVDWVELLEAWEDN